jgi:hypothetical protein
MKWTFAIGPKLKVCVLLAIGMALIVISNLMARKNIKDVNSAIVTIYEDRLIPASDMFSICDLLYQKRFLIDQLIFIPERDSTKSLKQLKACNLEIDALLNKYEQTYLVANETRFLNKFKQGLNIYNKLEQSTVGLIMAGEITAAKKLYEGEVSDAHAEAIATLIELNKIQTSVGSEIIKDSKHILNISTIFSALQILLAIAIGVVIMKLIAVSKMINKPQDDYHMN